MATVRRVVHVGDKPSPEELEEIRKNSREPIVYDDEAPELSTAQLAYMAELAKEKKKADHRVPVGLRIKESTLNKAKATGKGYTGFLARLIDNAIDDEELVKKSL